MKKGLGILGGVLGLAVVWFARLDLTR